MGKSPREPLWGASRPGWPASASPPQPPSSVSSNPWCGSEGILPLRIGAASTTIYVERGANWCRQGKYNSFLISCLPTAPTYPAFLLRLHILPCISCPSHPAFLLHLHILPFISCLPTAPTDPALHILPSYCTYMSCLPTPPSFPVPTYPAFLLHLSLHPSPECA